MDMGRTLVRSPLGAQTLKISDRMEMEYEKMGGKRGKRGERRGEKRKERERGKV